MPLIVDVGLVGLMTQSLDGCSAANIPHPGEIQTPRRAAWAASSAREDTPSLPKMLDRWLLIVSRETKSRSPIWALLWPAMTCWITCSSVGVMLRQPLVGRLRAPRPRGAEA